MFRTTFLGGEGLPLESWLRACRRNEDWLDFFKNEGRKVEKIIFETIEIDGERFKGNFDLEKLFLYIVIEMFLSAYTTSYRMVEQSETDRLIFLTSFVDWLIEERATLLPQMIKKLEIETQ